MTGESMVLVASSGIAIRDIEIWQGLNVLRYAAPAAARRANKKHSFGQGYFSHRYINPGIIIANCGRKFKMTARSFHRQPTYTQPAAPINCRKLFQGVIPSTWKTMAISMVQALAHFT
jgi:hypothetical protein